MWGRIAINDEDVNLYYIAEFLGEIDRITPWEEWMNLIKPYYYKGERGNKPYDLERMLRIYLVQNLYNLSDMASAALQSVHSR